MIPNQWYPILESRQLSRSKPLGVTRLGERLVVAVDANGSEPVARGASSLRGSALDRASVLAALECVDAVVLVAPDKTSDLVRSLQPHVMVAETT